MTTYGRGVRGLRRAAALFGVVLLVGCDLGPSGPESYDGAVVGDANLGAAVLDVTWPGVAAFAGQGSTQVYWAPVAGFPDRYRVVLISPDAGELPFTAEVDDVYLQFPVVTVVEAARTDNARLSVAGLSVVLGN